jgi:hypothetical protein
VLLYAHATQAGLWFGSHRLIARGRLAFGLPPGRLNEEFFQRTVRVRGCGMVALWHHAILGLLCRARRSRADE